MSASDIKTLFEAGAHYGYSRARRHPTAAPYIFSTKDRTDIFDLELTEQRLEAAKAFVASVVATGRQVLFVGGKNEAMSVVRSLAEQVNMPFVAGRWIGGTLTNFKNIRKRLERLERLSKERETGELDKYTKRERLMIDREIEELTARFGGLVSMSDLPGALFVIDSRHEDTAVKEANQLKIPVIGLSSSDCDFSMVQYPIPANDTSVRSIRLFAEEVASAVSDGKRTPAKVAA